MIVIGICIGSVVGFLYGRKRAEDKARQHCERCKLMNQFEKNRMNWKSPTEF